MQQQQDQQQQQQDPQGVRLQLLNSVQHVRREDMDAETIKAQLVDVIAKMTTRLAVSTWIASDRMRSGWWPCCQIFSHQQVRERRLCRH